MCRTENGTNAVRIMVDCFTFCPSCYYRMKLRLTARNGELQKIKCPKCFCEFFGQEHYL